MGEPSRKLLSSWKEIASYLDRDLSTVSRWEKQFGLPVHRAGGAKGRSVFAYTDEIDEWLARAKPEQVSAPSDPPAYEPVEGRKPAGSAIHRWTFVGLAGLVLATFAWTRDNVPGAIHRVTFSSNALTAYDANQNVRWTASPGLKPDTQLVGPDPTVVDLNNDGTEEVLIGTQGDASTSGEIISLSRQGKVQWHVQPEAKLRFGTEDYGGPWPGQSWKVAQTFSSPTIAFAVRHWTWWPSILSTVDASGKITGTFVNSGWIYVTEAVDQPSEVFLAGGVSNSQDAGMLAVLDAQRVTGTSPEKIGSAFECRNCPEGKPLRYFVFPRSEINRVTASQYNRVDAIQVLSDRVIINTHETAGILEQTEGAINAIYEFTRDMSFRSAGLHHKYWDLHRRLELQGRLDHTREECPERDGPPSIRIWTPEKGWNTIATQP